MINVKEGGGEKRMKMEAEFLWESLIRYKAAGLAFAFCTRISFSYLIKCGGTPQVIIDFGVVHKMCFSFPFLFVVCVNQISLYLSL